MNLKNKQKIQTLLAQGNRFAAMNLFIQNKFKNEQYSSVTNEDADSTKYNYRSESNNVMNNRDHILDLDEKQNNILSKTNTAAVSLGLTISEPSEEVDVEFVESDSGLFKSCSYASSVIPHVEEKQDKMLSYVTLPEPQQHSLSAYPSSSQVIPHTRYTDSSTYTVESSSVHYVSNYYSSNKNAMSVSSGATSWQSKQFPTLHQQLPVPVEKTDKSEDSLIKGEQKAYRDNGRPYISRATGKKVEGRTIGLPCKCKKNCWAKVRPGVEQIFQSFWNMGNFNEQNVYLYGNISIKPVHRHYVKGSKRRIYTFTYWVRVDGKHIEICKEMFMSAHGLQNCRGRVGNLMRQMKMGSLLPKPDQRGKHANRPNKFSDVVLSRAKHHIKGCINRNIPVRKMYREFYIPWCQENKLKAVSEDKYRRIYTKELKPS